MVPWLVGSESQDEQGAGGPASCRAVVKLGAESVYSSKLNSLTLTRNSTVSSSKFST